MRAPTRLGKFAVTRSGKTFTCAWRMDDDATLTAVVYNDRKFAAATLMRVAPFADLSSLARTAAADLLNGKDPAQRGGRGTVQSAAGSIPAARPFSPEGAAIDELVARLRATEQHLLEGKRRIAEVSSRLEARAGGTETPETGELLARLDAARSLYSATCERVRRDIEASKRPDEARRIPRPAAAR
jgi:hypothetical protein